MADSRRFMTKFKVAVSLYLGPGYGQDSTDFLESGDYAKRVAYPNYYAFRKDIYSGNMIALIWGRVLSEAIGYPTSAILWTDTIWGAKEHTIQLHNGYGQYMPPLQRATTGYVYRQMTTTSWEGMYVSFYHQIEVKNNSFKTLTINVSDMSNTVVFSSGTSGSVEPTITMSAETETTIGAGETGLITGFEPLQIRFDNDAIGGYDFSVTDQNESVRRISGDGSGGYTLTTADGSIINTPVLSGVLNDDGQIVVDDYITVTEGTKPIFANLGTGIGKPLFANIGSSIGRPLFAAEIKEEPEPGAPTSIDSFAYITISWTGAGYSDLDCCAYWTDIDAQKVGWSYSAGSVNDPFKAVWQGDNIGTGPEYIQVGVDGNEATGVTTLTYRIHLNFYGSGSGTSTANVEVTYGDFTLDKTISPSTNRNTKATTSDPYVTITFNADGTPDSIV